MARGYKRYKVDNFPELDFGEIRYTNYQHGLPFPENPHDDQPHDSIKLLGFSKHNKFLQYQVWHEVNVSGLWRYENRSLRSLIEIKEMTAYRDPDTPYVYFKSTQHSNGFLRKFAESVKDFHAYEREINLYKMTQELEGKITGARFGDLKIQNVRTVAIYGDRVTESTDYERYTAYGVINSVLIQLSLSGGALTLALSRDGTTVIYNAQNEREDLETLLELEEIVKPFVTRQDDIAFTL